MGQRECGGAGSVEAKDDLNLLLMTDYVESLRGGGYRNSLHKLGHVRIKCAAVGATSVNN